ncbi:MAG: AtpZ/AtpI family protein [Geminicoccaceae bacterium]|nr:AtpZ/AtpI family protein [Geminicoccaceae bacterium]
MAQDESPPPFRDFDARLKSLRGGRERGETVPEAEAEPQKMRFGDGLQVGVEILAGVGGGSLIGWALDAWLGTAPFLLVVFFFLGAAAGMLNAYRHLRKFMAPGADDRG